MDGDDYSDANDVAMMFKRLDPFAEQRALRLRGFALVVSAILYAWALADVTGHNLPSPLEVWDRFVTVAWEIARISA